MPFTAPELETLRSYGYTNVVPSAMGAAVKQEYANLEFYLGNAKEPVVEPLDNARVLISRELVSLLNANELIAYVNYRLEETAKNHTEALAIGTAAVVGAAAVDAWQLTRDNQRLNNKQKLEDTLAVIHERRSVRQHHEPMSRRAFGDRITRMVVGGVAAGVAAKVGLDKLSETPQNPNSLDPLTSAKQKIERWYAEREGGQRTV